MRIFRQIQNHMNMIRHDDGFVHAHIRVMALNLIKPGLRNFSVGGQGRWFPEKVFLFMGAYGHKIKPWRAVIKFSQPWIFANRKHVFHSSCVWNLAHRGMPTPLQCFAKGLQGIWRIEACLAPTVPRQGIAGNLGGRGMPRPYKAPPEIIP